MKQFLTIALILTFQLVSPAQSPRMTVRGQDGVHKLLELEQADVAVRILGDIAETVLDLRFRNDGDRAVEGEFVLPLPEGATVSGYALEVNGRMRDGVAVEKERARIAYESVKRRMIDPGIVEREAGNIYRTKVYPVPARGTKRLRISYYETLRSSAQGFAYSLPLDFPGSLDSFTCHLSGTAAGGMRVTDAAGLEFVTDRSGGLRAVQRNARLADTLKLVVKEPENPQVIVENEAQPAFVLSTRVPDIAPRPRPAPVSVMLVWDASQSGRERDHVKELELLDGWFAKLGRTRVMLRLLRDRLEDGGEFEILGGRWSKLKQVLQQVDYDGATAMSRLQVPAGQAGLVVYVGDGVATLGFAPATVSVPLVIIHSGSGAATNPLARLAHASGGVVIDLSTESQRAALTKLTRQPLRLLTVHGADLKDVLLDGEWTPGQPLRIFGTLREPRPGKIELCYGYDSDIVTTREIIYQASDHPDGMVRRLHAQRVLAGLEQQARPDRQVIIDHCKRYGLVSDFTSLIVLERIEDYAEHEIPPPEQELLADYRKRVEARASQRAADLGGLAYAWPAKLHWFEQRFPGYEALLLPRMRQVQIWKKASESQFAPAQRDDVAFTTVAGWLDKGLALIAGKPELRTPDDYQTWRKALDDLHAQGPKLALTPLHPPPAGQALTVSVRGRVTTPGLVTGESGMTLRQAVDKAGTLDQLAGLDSVALYRNAGKIVYNTLSERYQDVPLFPGDMLVVGQVVPLGRSDADPFANPFASPPADPRKEAPVREQADVWTTPSANREAFDDQTGSGGPATERAAVPLGTGSFPMTPATPTGTPPRIYSPPPRPDRIGAGTARLRPRQIERRSESEAAVQADDRAATASPDLTILAEAVAGGGDPGAAYRSLKGGRIYQPRFYLEAARILFAGQHAALGRRVLSNLVELRPGDYSALRGYAFWLAGFGQAADAEEVLGMLPNDGLLACMDLSSIRATHGDLAAAAAALSPPLVFVASGESGSLATIALTDFNALYHSLGKAAPPHPIKRYPQNLAADIRIVLTSTGDADSLDFKVTEPGGFACSAGATPSPCGGRVSASGGVREYMIRHAVPGVYQISCVSDHAATIRAVIHTDWGRPQQTTRVITLLLDADMPRQVAEVEHAFQPHAP